MDTTPLTHLTDIAFQILAPIALALGGYLAHRVAKAIESRFKIDIPDAQEKMVDQWIAQGIRYAEEKAHQAAQKGDAKWTGNEKLEAAAGFALDFAEKNGWVEWTRDLLKAKVDAKINIVKSRPGSPAGK